MINTWLDVNIQLLDIYFASLSLLLNTDFGRKLTIQRNSFSTP
jgi:hypothetical protein